MVGCAASLTRRLGWSTAVNALKHTVETELLVNQIAEAGQRISALVANAKGYSQMDRAPFQVVDVHDLLHSTLMMFGNRVGTCSGINVVRGI